MTLGSFGNFSSPEIDRESDLLREIERLLEEIEYFKDCCASLHADLQETLNAPCPHWGERQ